jgi:phosphoribosylpyrophosphate synthetase
VLFTNRSYSNTTAKHIGKVRYALNHKDKIYVNNPNASVVDNLIAFSKDLKAEFDIIENTRRRPHTRDAAKANVDHIIKTATAYCLAMDTTLEKQIKLLAKSVGAEHLIAASLFKKAMDAGYDHTAFLLNLNKKLTAAKLKADKERKIKAAEKLEKWLAGENNTYYLDQQFTPVMLRKRVIDEETTVVETTMGASVSFKAAKVLYDMIKSGRDIKGHVIDNYTVIGINGTLKVGCHEIPTEEVKRFATQNNW